ncbi:DUF4270 domain-containing protein [Cognatitamlana onchidii]|uniref:DUF4270 domain-containing protein n=1 Tax=Cognatitamlana onchidii TaxID=2562860 RepID=UPI0010A5A760|nr:DUF4270 domain-containing protein [Algibacter onchidii]
MKKTINALKFSVALILIFSAFFGCDKEFNAIDSDVLGPENFNFATRDSVWPVTAYNKKLDSLQVNNLRSILLGIYNDPAYGETKASIVTQITPTSFSPSFGVNPVMDSVIMSIPYFSTAISTDTDGFPIYRLDSLYGNSKSSIKLTIYENGYFLRDFDPSNPDDLTQNYYSNGNSAVNSALNGSSVINFDEHIVNIDMPILNIDAFIPDSTSVKTSIGTGDNKVTTRSDPAFRYELDKDFWTKTIIDMEGDPVLSNANNFRNYFRGLYFKVESNPSQEGNMILFNLLNSAANITLYYTQGEDASRSQSSYTLNFSGNRFNTFINNYKVALVNGDKDAGDAILYLKGMQGSMAVVDLFKGMIDCDGDGVAEEDALKCFIDTFRQIDNNGNYIQDPLTNRFLLKRLINEAHLVVFEDENIDNGGDENYHLFDRIYAYDLENNRPTIDYSIDQTENSQDPFNSKVISLVPRNPENGKFKIRITEHLNNILIRDSTNTKIGLVMSTNVNYIDNSEILNSEDEVTQVPSATILSPRGSVVYGSNDNVDKDKKLALKIFFTESK